MAALLLGACHDGGGASPSAESSTTTSTLVPERRWTALPPSPLSARFGPLVTWTGEEFIVAGGNVETAPAQTSPSKEAAAFNPKTGQWQRLPDAPQPLPDDAVFAWTGTEFIVVGGSLPDTPAPVDTRLRGVAYSPATNQWRRIAPSPLRAPGRARADGALMQTAP